MSKKEVSAKDLLKFISKQIDREEVLRRLRKEKGLTNSYGAQLLYAEKNSITSTAKKLVDRLQNINPDTEVYIKLEGEYFKIK
jgi:hypothetical protein